jgi:hypothetical protein
MPAEMENVEDFNAALDRLSQAIQDAIAQHIKTTKPSPYSKRWWTKELADEKKTM